MLRRSDSWRLGRFVAAASLAAACSGGTSSSNATSSNTLAAADASTPSLPDTASAEGQAGDDRVCAPAPQADCSNASSFDPAVQSGSDLTGIDLRNALIGDDVSLSSTVLIGARLDGAAVLGSLRGADLTNATLTGADLSASDLTGATLTGADLTGALVNATFVDADGLSTALVTRITVGVRSGETLAGGDLSGLDLTGARFASSVNGLVSAGGARFTGATLTGASFFRIDLTGADFTDVIFGADSATEPTFTETRCPDFLPSDATLSGRAACRL